MSRRFRSESRIPSAIFTLCVLALSTPLARSADSLNFWKNYFVTGDYTAAGVGLRGTGVSGWATGTINITGVPCTRGVGALSYESCAASGAVASDIVAAFLYWETEETTQNTSASGYFDGNAITGAALGSSSNPACEGSNGATGPSGTYAHVYRADVLPFLKVDTVNNIRLANGVHTVKFADSGNSKSPTLPLTNGATLVVVYKVVVPGNPFIAPLKSVVFYDGAFTLGKGTSMFSQTVGGFYQATGFGANMTPIVANGQSSSQENFTINGSAVNSRQYPIDGSAGVRWDNPSIPINLAPNAASYSTQATADSGTCLTWAAVVTSTPVVDSDADGLLDVWETRGIHLNTTTSPATFGGCSDYPTDPCVDLPAMGASLLRRDIFLQIDWMHGTGDGTGGQDGHGTHDHIPTLNALSMVCSTYAGHGIALHFDVGNNYQGQPCIIPSKKDSYGNLLTQGGSDIAESTLVCQNSATVTCTYNEPYPILSFKRGFVSVRDGDPVLNLPAHFSHERKDSFHYVLFAHALAGPFSATGVPLTTAPSSVSGIADRPGGDVMVTLGLWRTDVPSTDQVGTDLIQAGTLMHELGHNLDLSHYGLYRTPNCAPQYQSVMNYLYQTRGLTDTAGNEHIDYSYGVVLPFLSENNPTSHLFLNQYRIRYYAPLNPAINTAGQAAQVYCAGDPITDGGLQIRLEGASLATPDWSNGTGDKASPPLDLNFDGIFGQTFTDQPDWFVLNLQQVGGRPNANGASSDVGFADEGFADEGFADEGFADEGFADEGFADEGVTDGDVDLNTNILSGAPAPTNLTVTNTISSNQLSWTPPSAGQVVNYNIYRCAVISPATACTIPTTPFLTIPGGSATPAYSDTVNDTTDSGKGGSAACSVSTCYNTVYDYQVTAVLSATVNNVLTTNESSPTNQGSAEVTHLFVLANGQSIVYGTAIPSAAYTIYGDVSGSLSSGVTCSYSPSTPSPNSPPVGVYPIVCAGPATSSATDGVTYNAAYLINKPGALTITPRPITVTAVASSKTYDGGVSSTSTPMITSGSLAYSDSVTWSETYDNKNVGATHVMTPAGTVSDGNGGKNYTVTFVPINTGVIIAAPLAINAVTNTKTYDGTTSAAAIPTPVGIQPGDTVTGLAETYNTPNVGTGLTLTVSPGYTVNDGNSGKNYTTTVNTNTTGVINRAPVTANIAASNKNYDGTTAASITGCTVGGVLPVDTANLSCTAMAAAFASPNAGTWTVTASVALGGSAQGNYVLSSGTATTSATILPAPLAIMLSNMTQVYTGGLLAPTVGTTPPNIAVTLTGAPATSANSYPVSASSNNPNYTGSTTGVFVIQPFPLTITATGVNKNFDGTTAATVTLSDNRVSLNDTFTDTYASASFATSSPGTGIAVRVTGLSISGPGATNYTLTSGTAATTANISSTINLSALSLNSTNSPGLPALINGGLELTNSTGQTSSAWLGAAVPINASFSTTFQFQISPASSGADSIGDGFAFVIQADPSGAATLGTTGAGDYIGYAGITNSLAIEFDTYQNTDLGDPAGPHIGIQSLGTAANTSNHNTQAANLGGPVRATFADNTTHSATITYNGTTLSVYLDGGNTPVVSATVNLGTRLFATPGANAFIGFTAANGSAQENTTISSWTWSQP